MMRNTCLAAVLGLLTLAGDSLANGGGITVLASPGPLARLRAQLAFRRALRSPVILASSPVFFSAPSRQFSFSSQAQFSRPQFSFGRSFAAPFSFGAQTYSLPAQFSFGAQSYNVAPQFSFDDSQAFSVPQFSFDAQSYGGQSYGAQSYAPPVQQQSHAPPQVTRELLEDRTDVEVRTTRVQVFRQRILRQGFQQ